MSSIAHVLKIVLDSSSVWRSPTSVYLMKRWSHVRWRRSKENAWWAPSDTKGDRMQSLISRSSWRPLMPDQLCKITNPLSLRLHSENLSATTYLPDTNNKFKMEGGLPFSPVLIPNIAKMVAGVRDSNNNRMPFLNYIHLFWFNMHCPLCNRHK